MALPVLTPGRRRRRRWPYVLAAATAAVLAALGAWHARPGATPSAAAGPAAPTTTIPVQPPPPAEPAPAPANVVETLVHGPPVSRHRFRPPLGARAAIVIDEASGRVLWWRNPHRRLPIASTTKIMTALLALERLDVDRPVTIGATVPRTAPTREGLLTGERVPAWKLLNGLLVFSANDSAVALALAVAGSRSGFVALMNERARELGLRHTHFSSPSGVVDRDNLSTPWDLAALARYARRNARFRAIVDTRVARVRWSRPTYAKVYVNRNRLLWTYRGADGVKTGWTTKAQHCLVASAHRGGRRLVTVVLGSPDAFTDARRLLDLGFSRSA
jgi:D-alanyl-D-alanine carboxypeptidase (penicillin-binding protein 5/6)